MPANADLRIVPARVEPSEMRHASQVSKVYTQLRDLIVDGRLAPGTRIIELDLASRLGVSRTPVRDALRMLQQEGFIAASLPGGIKSRLIVAPLTKRDAQEIFALAGRLEGWAARLATQLSPDLRHSLCQKLRVLNDRLREILESGRPQPRNALSLDLDFHRYVVEANAGSRLLAMHGTIKLQLERYRRVYSHLPGQANRSVEEHDLVVRGIESGDASLAEEGILANLQNAWERLSEAMDALGERGSW